MRQYLADELGRLSGVAALELSSAHHDGVDAHLREHQLALHTPQGHRSQGTGHASHVTSHQPRRKSQATSRTSHATNRGQAPPCGPEPTVGFATPCQNQAMDVGPASRNGTLTMHFMPFLPFLNTILQCHIAMKRELGYRCVLLPICGRTTMTFCASSIVH